MNYIIGRTVVHASCITVVMVTLSLSAHAGELWACRNRVSAVVSYTNTPVNSGELDCKPLSNGRGSLTKIAFDGYLEAARAKLGLRSESSQPEGEEESPGSVEDENAVPPAKRERTVKGSYITSWKAEQLDSKDNGSKRQLHMGEPVCKIAGQASGPIPGNAVVKITRGGATVDLVDVQIRGGKGKTKWSVLLKGLCRNPEVRVDPTG